MSSIRNGLTILLLAISTIVSAQDINLALNKTSSTSGVEAAYVAANAFDGQGGSGQVTSGSGNCSGSCTRWSSAFSDPQWLMVDLGGIYRISQINLYWEVANGKDFQIQISPTGSTWTTLNNITGNSSFVNNFTYGSSPLPSGRYVRMYGTARNTVYGFSLWEMEVRGPNTILPIRLSGFSAKAVKDKVALDWTAYTDVATNFSIERSINGIDYLPIGTIAGMVSSNSTPYQFTDASPANGKNYYRLKWTDKTNGAVTYSEIASITMLEKGAVSISPNPVRNGIVHGVLSQPYSGALMTKLYNASGILLNEQTQRLSNSIGFTATMNGALPKGIYWLDVVQNQTVWHQKILVE